MYDFNKPLNTGNYAPLAAPRLQVEGDFTLRLDDIDKVTINNNKMLDFRFTVVDGPHKNQQHTESFYLWQDDPVKVDFAIRIMASVCRALNNGQDSIFKGSADLVNKTCQITRIRDGEYKGNPQYASRNWRPAGTVVVTVPPTGGTADVKIENNHDGTVTATAELKNDVDEVAEDVEPADIPW